MSTRDPFRRLALGVALIAGAAGLLPADAREPARGPRAARTPRTTVTPEDGGTVLEAEAKGLIKLTYIPNDARSAQVIVHNTSGKPLSLRLPDAFVGVPVLAQMGMGGGGMGMGGMGGGGMGGGGGFQTGGGGGMGGMGGGMGGMGGGMGGMGGGVAPGGAFSVPPEKTRVVRVATVCLEYGKHDPMPRVPYRMQELDSFSTDPKLAAVLEALGRGVISQKVAQAAAWHLSSGLSWEQLAAEKIDHVGVPDEAYFHPAELRAAHQLVEQVTRTTVPAVETSASGS